MLRLVILLAVFVLITTDDLMGVNYSFDVDFYHNFNSKKCDNENMWRLVRYGELNVEPPDMDSDKAILAVGESCASSFPIIFVGGTLEIKVYSQDISNSFNLSIDVFDEDDACVTSYRRSSEGIEPGWQTISLKMNKHVQGYINLRGRSLKNEILLIDSFRYTPNDTITYDDRRTKRSVDSEKEDEEEIIFKYKVYKEQSLEGSGDGDHETEPPTGQPVVEPERNTFWNPFTISLVSFGGVVVILMFVVGAYHYGKVKARGNAQLPLVDTEPPRTITIPRVNGRSNRNRPSRFYDF